MADVIDAAEQEREAAQHRHQGRGREPQVRRGRARRLDGGQCGGLRRPAGGAPVQGRPVQPDLPADHAGQEIRPAPQAAGQAAAVGPRRRPRVQGDHRARHHRLPGGQDLWPVHRRRVIGTWFYVMDMVEGRILWDQSLPQYDAGRAPADLSWPRSRPSPTCTTPTTQAIGLEDFGRPGNYMGRQIDRWTKQYKASETAAHPGDGTADRVAAQDPARQDDRPRSSTATTASTT